MRMNSPSNSLCTTWSARLRVSRPIIASRASSWRDASTSQKNGSKNTSAASSKAMWCLRRLRRALPSSQTNGRPLSSKWISTSFNVRFCIAFVDTHARQHLGKRRSAGFEGNVSREELIQIARLVYEGLNTPPLNGGCSAAGARKHERPESAKSGQRRLFLKAGFLSYSPPFYRHGAPRFHRRTAPHPSLSSPALLTIPESRHKERGSVQPRLPAAMMLRHSYSRSIARRINAIR